jgi:Protein of unknown function (DUF1553)
VTVNRTWHKRFGTGILETTEDFGIMGRISMTSVETRRRNLTADAMVS